MQRLFKAFKANGFELFLVGGSVRDFHLGYKSNDMDFATSAHPEQTCAVLKSMGLISIPIGIEFGTIQTILDNEKVEITTFRCNESYTKGSRKPGVVFGTTIESDLARRDFTFNAMAQDGDGNIIDPFNGLTDLRNGTLRTPINPEESFGDDPLRMLRVCRFVARNFVHKIHPDTHNAMRKMSALIMDSVSRERIVEETSKLLMADEPVAGLHQMEHSGLIRVIFPELQVLVNDDRSQGKWHHLNVWYHTLEVVRNSGPTLEQRWAALFHDVAKPICRSTNETGIHYYKHSEVGTDIWNSVAKRLKMSNSLRDHVGTLIFEHQNFRRCVKTKAIRRLMFRVGDCLDDLISLSRADIVSHHPHTVKASLEELRYATSVADKIKTSGGVSDSLPAGTGTLIAEALNIKPGPILGEIVKRLKSKMVDGILKPDDDMVKAAIKVQNELNNARK